LDESIDDVKMKKNESMLGSKSILDEEKVDESEDEKN
jgi:hypothetical protein